MRVFVRCDVGEPPAKNSGPQVFHVNYHTQHNRHVFEVPEYDAVVRQAVLQTIEKWQIHVLAWQVMPTHLHLIVLTFPDRTLGTLMRLIKGATARAVLLAAPELRADLGDHLWQEGYHWVEITTSTQCANTVRYVRENRKRGGLED
jgi:REP-associated tyrosine transposase